jgi:hypothetical protein
LAIFLYGTNSTALLLLLSFFLVFVIFIYLFIYFIGRLKSKK